MENLNEGETEKRLRDFLQQIGKVLRNKKQRACFAGYATGLLGNAERKSAEPMAALLWPDPDELDAAHQRLLHFVGQADWQDSAVRSIAARYALDAMTRREPVQSWICDDTGFLKQGKHSVGVQRQYTGSAGKVTNCQVGASLTFATQTMHLPVDFELYLPHSWADDPTRRAEAKIPNDVQFRTKPQLALAMIDRALSAELPKGTVLADASYGNNGNFRVGLRQRGLSYAVDIEGSTKVRPMQRTGRLGTPVCVRDLALSLGIRAYRRVRWREGSKQTLWSNFARLRVAVERDCRKLGKRETLWLLAEWPDDESLPTKFALLTAPKHTALDRLVRISRQRWRTERAYEDLKGELGLDHYEGRRFRGWHHHVTIALCCYAFVAAEHARSFPPTARRPRPSRTDRRPTGTSLRGLPHHGPARGRTHPRSLASSVPRMPPSTSSPSPFPAQIVTQ